MTNTLKQPGPLANLKKIIKHGLLRQTILEAMWEYHIVYMPFYWVLETHDPETLKNLKEEFRDYTFEPFGPEEIKQIAKIKGRSRHKKEHHMLALLEQGKKCYGIKHKGRIACFSWASFDGTTLARYRPTMGENEVYLFDMYTLKPFRGTNISTYLRFNVYKALLDTGPYTFYSITDIYNKPAIRFKQKIKARNIKMVYYFRLFNLFYFKEYDIK